MTTNVASFAPKTLSSAQGAVHQDLLTARRVLAIEAQGISLLASSLNENFVKAVNVMMTTKGHIIISGIGKSGHIGRKIAATLASTGTPAFFVHPAEASHGDLGMITKNDAVVALSESGNSAELAGVIDYTRRLSIPLIAMTRNKRSLLGMAADYHLLLPPAEPACPMRLAPTTSTTMMLALGDALAVTLLEKKGFSPEDFQAFHPGGQLGRMLMRVEDLMHKDDELPMVTTATPLQEVIITISQKRFGCVGVLEGNALKGIITDGDLRRHLNPAMFDKTAADIMTPAPKTIAPHRPASEAVALMNQYNITVLFVVDAENRPLGVLHLHDCLHVGIR